MNKVFENRPPNLWNEPDSLKDEHQLRCSSDPFLVYKDSRIKDLYERIQEIAKHLAFFKKERWTNLVSRVIDVFEKLDSDNVTRI
jgi:hypothetical protein